MQDTPVLMIIFNRPDFTARVFEVIKMVKPDRLFIAADGPRTANEKERTDATRKVVENVDWPCEVRYNFSDENLGCGVRPFTAISWAFGYTDELIILEDDCLPSESFFPFCKELLSLYKNDTRIGTINGTCIPASSNHTTDSYYFSRFSVIWGWATWKRVWDKYDFDIAEWSATKNTAWLTNALYGNEYYAKGFSLLFNAVKKGWDVWDIQLFYLCLKNNYLNIHPSENLITNMGFDGSGTHTHHQNSIQANIPLKSIQWPLVHPKAFVHNHKADEVIFNALYKFDLTPATVAGKVLRNIIYRLRKILQ